MDASIREPVRRLSQGGTLARLYLTALRWTQPEIARWEAAATAIPDPELRRQALASLRTKRFHAEGGTAYAVGAPARQCRRLARLIVALQTISDYLDNLCDRMGVQCEEDFRCLHGALLDAVTPEAAPAVDYYRRHPWRHDGGYLAALVTACRRDFSHLPSYPVVRSAVQQLAALYVELQCLKHLPPRVRGPRLRAWCQSPAVAEAFGAAGVQPRLAWWELAAATGSTLGIFALFRLAATPGVPAAAAEATARSYFPDICALHILLDYLIDQEEDRQHGDFNFVACYGPGAAADGLARLLQRARTNCRHLPEADFHETVVCALPGFYLADPKADAPALTSVRRRLLQEGDWRTRSVFAATRARHRLARALTFAAVATQPPPG
ncbi:MAG: DUF2600 family protein [Clostridia bacterium]|nr:DUF2600 family protein [Clostridia bacterium]